MKVTNAQELTARIKQLKRSTKEIRYLHSRASRRNILDKQL